jgi:hypothetical protein
MSDHGEHRAGTVSNCLKCKAIAYEPSWYAAMLAFGGERNLTDTFIRLTDHAEAITTPTGPLWT